MKYYQKVHFIPFCFLNVCFWGKYPIFGVMDISATYTTALTPLIPFFSALACGILVAFSLQDCLKLEERKLKRIVLFYLFLSGLGWIVTFFYEFVPVLFVWLNIACLVSYILPSVFFYRIIRYLTRLGRPEAFPPLHYLLPVMLVAVMLVWSLFVPFDVQLEIVTGKAQVLPVGYEAYARFFTTKPLLRVVFGLVYYLLVLWVVLEYYRKAVRKKKRGRKPARWVLFLVGISLASLFSSVLPTFMPRGEILYSVWTLSVALSIAAQHVLLSYHIMRRDYYPYILRGKTRNPLLPVGNRMPRVRKIPQPRRQFSRKLNRHMFEEFIRNKKPYLNPSYKITDMVNDLDVNRTSLSTLINRTYGMNFNSYLNHLRLRELEQLRLLPDNEEKNVRLLLGQVGFHNYRTYLRAINVERKSAAKRPQVREEEGGMHD